MQPWKEHHDPTQLQRDRTEEIQIAIIDLLNDRKDAGFQPPEMLAGIVAATADLITTAYGPTAVQPWFQKQSEMFAELLKDIN